MDTPVNHGGPTGAVVDPPGRPGGPLGAAADLQQQPVMGPWVRHWNPP